MITIETVTTKKQMKAFINFPLKLFKGVPQFSPSIYEDEMDNLTPSKNPASTWCDFKLFLAYENGKIVGRIAGIINYFANDKYKQKRVRFNRIDMIDDINVTTALISAVEAWGKENGLTEIVGPLGYSDQDKEGLLVEGFEHMNMFATAYHFPYYKEHLEKLEFISDAQWVEHRISIPKTIEPRFERISEMVKQKYDVNVRKLKNKRNLKPYVRDVLSLTNKAYADLYGYVPISDQFMDKIAKQYIPLLNLDYLILIYDNSEKLVGFGVAIPSPVFALKRIKGKLFPFGFIRFLRSLKHSKQLDLLLIAVQPELRNSGIANLILHEAVKSAIKNKIQYAETGPQLEWNSNVQNLWKRFDFTNHKRRICYVRSIR